MLAVTIDNATNRCMAGALSSARHDMVKRKGLPKQPLPVRSAVRLLALQRKAAEALVEAGDLTALIQQAAVTAGPCRVNLGIDVELHRVAFLAPGGAGFEHGAVGHLHLDGVIIGMNVGLHGARSEEHTSELQSLMRISYAVFCLKK